MANPGDRRALEELTRHSRIDEPLVLRHYLYFRDSAAASAVGKRIGSQDFNVVIRRGADGVDWLVLASQRVVPGEEAVEATRQLLENVASEYGGEYDGWEAEVAE